MNKKLSTLTRIIALVAAAGLVAVIFLPIWRIELSAPQYPEGLVLQIFASKLGGDVEVVNGLNHYIGMRTLHAKDFVEFTVLPYIIGALAFFGLLSAIINRKWFYLVWGVLFVLFCVVAMIDFYLWEHNYGHNLDPTAPIQVPGMTYQPPLIGYKKLLNFGAYSIPDKGGWIMVAVGIALLVTIIMELRTVKKKSTVSLKTAMAFLALPLMFLFSSCSTGPQPFRYGQDACDLCKMTIIDKKFGAQLITKKGKVFRFDDIHCLTDYAEKNISREDIGGIYLIDYAGTNGFIKAGESFLLKSENLRTPMNGQIASFSDEDSLKKYQAEIGGERLLWNQIYAE